MRKRPVAVMHTVLTAVGLLAAAASVWIAATGGVRFSVFDIDIRALNPYRPLALAVAALVLRVAIGGAASLRADIALLERACTPRAIAIALVILTVLVGLIAGSDVAGGADQYGYISQADLWLQGDPTIPQPYARSVPWPDAQWTLAPLGYRPSPDGVALVPTYAPGFPLLLALFKYAAGQCAIGWVVPFATGLLIASTFVCDLFLT